MKFHLLLRLSLLLSVSVVMVSCGSPAARESFTVAEPFDVVNAKTERLMHSMERPFTFFQDGMRTRRKDESATHSNYALWYYAMDTGNQWCTRFVDVFAQGNKTVLDVQTHEMTHESGLMETIHDTFPNAKREKLPLKEGTSRDFWLLTYGHNLSAP